MMHKGVQWVFPDTPIKDIAKKMKQHDVGAIDRRSMSTFGRKADVC
jgi:CBS domain-containing protein